MKLNFKKCFAAIPAYPAGRFIIGIVAVSLAVFSILFNGGATNRILDSYEFAQNGEMMVKYAYINKKVAPIKNEVQRTDSSYSQFLGENPDGSRVYKMTSYPGQTFYKERDKWYQIEYATTTPEEFARMTKPSLLAIAYAVNIFANAGDGRIWYQNGADWATAHDAGTGTDVSATSANSLVGVGEHKDLTGVYSIFRIFYPFDTSSIPANATIVSASLSLNGFTKNNEDNDGDDWLNVFQTSQATHTTLVAGDYDTIATTTEGATRIDFGSLNAGNLYDTWTLNSSGLGWIAKNGVASTCSATAGITCLGILEGHDALNSPVATNASSTIAYRFLEVAGTTQDPYLTVVYTVPVKTRIRGWIRFIGGIRFK